MELAVITAQQVLQLVLMIAAGAVCCRAGVFKPAEKSVLSNLLVYLVVPAMVLDSYMVPFDPATFRNLLLTFALSTVLLLLGMGVAWAASRGAQPAARPILWFACAFSNAGYMGFPLIRALFGEEGVLYASAFLTMFNILVWTLGVAVLSGKAEPRQVLRSVVTCPCTKYLS